MSWFGTSRLTPIGIDLDGRCIKAVQLRHVGGGKSRREWRIEAATILKRYDADQAIDTHDIDRLGEVLYRQGFVGTNVVLAVPNDRLMSGVLDVPPADSGAPVKEIARVELATVHKCDPESIEMSYWELPASRQRRGGGEGSRGCQVMAAACQQNEANTLIDFFEYRGWRVRALDIQAWAMTRACTQLLPSSQSIAALLNIGYKATQVVVLHQGIVVYERTIHESGLKTLYETIVTRLHLDPEMIEYILKEVGFKSQHDSRGRRAEEEDFSSAQGAIRTHFDSLIREVQASCSYASHQYEAGSSAMPGCLLVMGEGGAIPGLEEYVKQAVEVAVRVVRPTELAGFPDSVEKWVRDPSLTPAMGLAQYFEV